MQTYISDMVPTKRKKFTVSQVAEMLGIYRGTVINYEKRGIFRESHRNPINGYREYSESDVEEMRGILEGKKKGEN